MSIFAVCLPHLQLSCEYYKPYPVTSQWFLGLDRILVTVEHSEDFIHHLPLQLQSNPNRALHYFVCTDMNRKHNLLTTKTTEDIDTNADKNIEQVY